MLDIKFCVLDSTDGCGNDTFLCPKEDICIPISYKCNNVTDCLDGYDEKSCDSKSKKFLLFYIRTKCFVSFEIRIHCFAIVVWHIGACRN